MESSAPAPTPASEPKPAPAPAPVDPPQPAVHAQLMGTLPRVGTLHQIGKRNYQQDSLGHTAVLGDKGILAVLDTVIATLQK